MVEQLDRSTQELNHTKKDLERHKDTLSTTESLLHSQLEKLSEQLVEKNQEVLSKTQQVKQYKKQVDQYKEEMGGLRHQLDIQRQQVHSSFWKYHRVYIKCPCLRTCIKMQQNRGVGARYINWTIRHVVKHVSVYLWCAWCASCDTFLGLELLPMPNLCLQLSRMYMYM